MRTLHLYKEDELQGKFNKQNLNLLLTFQVNCPGCFIHALPLFNELYDKYKDQLGFLALSTAFEDYELNTALNTQLLIDTGELIGETKKHLAQIGNTALPYAIEFPIAMDAKMQDADKESMIENICHLNPVFETWSDDDKTTMRKRVSVYLQNQKEVPVTFTSNQFKGTPTLVLFNDKMEIIESWFGHIQKEIIVEKIEEII